MHAARRMEDLDRNLVALANELAVKCAGIFNKASGATGRQAVVESSSSVAPSDPSPLLRPGAKVPESAVVRDRMVNNVDEVCNAPLS